MFFSQKGNIIRVPAKGISVIGRNTQGVKLIRLEEGDKAVGVAKIVKEEQEENAAEKEDKPENPEESEKENRFRIEEYLAESLIFCKHKMVATAAITKLCVVSGSYGLVTRSTCCPALIARIICYGI